MVSVFVELLKHLGSCQALGQLEARSDITLRDSYVEL